MGHVLTVGSRSTTVFYRPGRYFASRNAQIDEPTQGKVVFLFEAVYNSHRLRWSDYNDFEWIKCLNLWEKMSSSF